MIELVDFNDLLTKDQSKKKKTRRRGGKKSSTTTPKNKENTDFIEDVEIIEDTPVVEKSDKETLSTDENSDKSSEIKDPPKKENK